MHVDVHQLGAGLERTMHDLVGDPVVEALDRQNHVGPVRPGRTRGVDDVAVREDRDVGIFLEVMRKAIGSTRCS
jgi:hypothetical protein